MYVSKKIRRAIVLSVMTGSLTLLPSFCPNDTVINLPVRSVAQAKVATYEGVGEDYPSQYENPNIAKMRAKQKAIQNARDKAGVALRSYSRSQNSELTDDDISAITSNSYEIIDEHFDR